MSIKNFFFRPQRIKNRLFVQWKKLAIFLSTFGPGLITSNIDNDAGGIATYSVAGAQTGYRLLWVLFPITLGLIFVQIMASKIGIVSGKGLADLIREKFGLKITFYTFIFLILADLGNTMAEFAGIAAAGEIFGISKYISVPVCSALVWFIVLKSDYKIVERIFLCGCLVYLSYILCMVLIAPPIEDVFSNLFVPNLQVVTMSDMPLIVGLIGTTITPWMQFYIQSAIVEKGVPPEHLKYSKIDVIFGCLLMSFVTLSIIVCCASTLHHSGISITNAKDAALALKPLAGEYSSLLFGIGLFNASFFAAALLPLATSYYVCEGLGWESGVNKSFKDAPNFFMIFTILVIFSSFMILIPNINLIKILVGSQIINGILIPFIIFFMTQIANDPNIMQEYTNNVFLNFISYAIILFMVISNSCLIYYELKNFF